jgi:hypothetical protein
MKNILITLLAIFIFGALHAQPSEWQVNSSEYEYSMTMSASVEFEGTDYGAENDYLAAFVNDTCRGVAEATYVEDYSKYMFFLTVFSNDYSGEEITFKYYSAEGDEVLTGFLKETFTEGNNLGTASDPYLVTDTETKEKYQVTFSVDDGTNPVKGATINIASQSLSTDTVGKATIKLVNGNYNYTITKTGYADASGTLEVAGTDVTDTVSLDNVTGIEDINMETIKVYPNPAIERINIDAEDVMAVELISLEGKVILRKEGNINGINVENCETGVYLLNVHTRKNLFTVRLLIK